MDGFQRISGFFVLSNFTECLLLKKRITELVHAANTKFSKGKCVLHIFLNVIYLTFLQISLEIRISFMKSVIFVQLMFFFRDQLTYIKSRTTEWNGEPSQKGCHDALITFHSRRFGLVGLIGFASGVNAIKFYQRLQS